MTATLDALRAASRREQATLSGTAPGLIHDQIVSKSVESRAGLKLSPMAWKTSNYRSYIETLASWATALEVEPTDVEE